MPKIMISAGEASGDLHAGALTKEILTLCPKAEVFGMGGERMRSAGAKVIFDIKEHGVMGLVDIFKKLPALFALKRALSKTMDERRPDCVVTIDYSEFNTYVVANLAHAKGIPVVSFIPPSVAIWRQGRAKYLAGKSSLVATIFPNENDIYLAAGAKAEYVGHPLIDVVRSNLTTEQAKAKAGKAEGSPLILLMPGSRKQEIAFMLPIILGAARIIHEQLPTAKFCMPCAGTVCEADLQAELLKYKLPINVTNMDTYDIMKITDVAIIKSGTATLEAALCGLPSVIVYKTSKLNEYIFKYLLRLKVPNFGLPNIIMGRRILPELLQEDANPERIAQEVLAMLEPDKLRTARDNLRLMRGKMGDGGAIRKVAQRVLAMCGENNFLRQ